MSGLVGLIPAAGKATRAAALPCSKELFPVGFMDVEVHGRLERRPKPVVLYVIDYMVAAGANRIFVMVSEGKWDILTYLGNGSEFGARVAYLVQENLWGMPHALNLARPWLGDGIVLFGMPDTIFQPTDAFQRLVLAHRHASADVTLGLFPTDTPERFGMVAFDRRRRMIETVDKPAQSDLEYMWGVACWGPSFTLFMDEQLRTLSPPNREIVLGDIFQAAVQSGLTIQVLPFEDGEYLDIGTLPDLAGAVRRFAQ